ncbi:MAG: ATP-dependent zinc protease [Sandaracinaceae bacterium]
MRRSESVRFGHACGLMKERLIIGTAERVDLPEWGVRGLRAKIDTGAKTSALHVDAIEELGGSRVRFQVVTGKKRRARPVTVVARVVRRTRVRSSTGIAEERIIVSTRLALGGREQVIEVSLTSRAGMIFRMLLGRAALHDVLIDPSRRYVLDTPTGKTSAGQIRAVSERKKKPRKKTTRAASSKKKPASIRKKATTKRRRREDE